MRKGLIVIASAADGAGQVFGIVLLVIIATFAIRDQMRKHRTAGTGDGPSENT